jgi:hypothetical protein
MEATNKNKREGICYMNKETGEILTRDQMEKQALEWYDVPDETNIFGYDYYYSKVWRYHAG